MHELQPLADQIAQLLIARRETVSVAESSAGGLISAALLAVPGASGYFLGSAVVYTRTARDALLSIPAAALESMRPSTEPYAQLLADSIRQKLNSSWSIGETGATGPTGNRYGDAAGHACLAVSGPVRTASTLETGSANREENMRTFASAALRLLLESLHSAPAPAA